MQKKNTRFALLPQSQTFVRACTSYTTEKNTRNTPPQAHARQLPLILVRFCFRKYNIDLGDKTRHMPAIFATYTSICVQYIYIYIHIYPSIASTYSQHLPVHEEGHGLARGHGIVVRHDTRVRVLVVALDHTL